MQRDRIAVQARLPHDLAKRLNEEAEERGLSKSKLIERALREFLGRGA
jgi:predicted transcriptional regulator